MNIAINFADGVPIYRQIVTQILYQIASGVVESDKALPSIRALAQEIKVAPNTIAKVYEELEAAGVVRKRRGFGTFVSLESNRAMDGERRRLVEQRIDALLAEARQLNFTGEALLTLIHRRQGFIPAG
jgi:GntR family transcriptional regulator